MARVLIIANTDDIRFFARDNRPSAGTIPKYHPINHVEGADYFHSFVFIKYRRPAFLYPYRRVARDDDRKRTVFFCVVQKREMSRVQDVKDAKDKNVHITVVFQDEALGKEWPL